jgi:rhodanese-related sulfurtransferase
MPDKRHLFAEFAHVGQVLSSGARLELLELLFQSERTVEELSDLTELSFANVSQHLQVLRQAHMVEVRRDGLFAYYRACDNGIFAVWTALRSFGEANVTGVQRVLGDFLKPRFGTEAVTAEELQQRMNDRSAIIIDVRPAEEFAAGHIVGAVSVPLNELATRLKELPKRTQIVAYCRGPYCVQSDAAIALLEKRGYNAKRLEFGLPDWRARGFPVGVLETAPRTKQARAKAPTRKKKVKP